MKLQTAIEILEYHQEWRLGRREDMIHEPKELTEALDVVLSEVKKFNSGAVSGSLRFSEREVDFAYLCGVFNTSGIDGLHNEIQRLKEIGKEPHDIIEACRKQ